MGLRMGKPVLLEGEAWRRQTEVAKSTSRRRSAARLIGAGY